jgi:hypothetical protein
MGKPTNIATTAHAQAAEFAALAGVATQPADTTALQTAYREAVARIDSLVSENEAATAALAAEKTAHEATQAALDAATKTE